MNTFCNDNLHEFELFKTYKLYNIKLMFGDSHIIQQVAFDVENLVHEEILHWRNCQSSLKVIVHKGENTYPSECLRILGNTSSRVPLKSHFFKHHSREEHLKQSATTPLLAIKTVLYSWCLSLFAEM